MLALGIITVLNECLLKGKRQGAQKSKTRVDSPRIKQIHENIRPHNMKH